jgi:hypothetical protein
MKQMKKDIIPLITDIANNYNVSVERSDQSDRNTAASAGDCIFMGEFDDSSIEILAFFHELGHTQSSKVIGGRNQFMSTLSCEGLAWELGMGLAYEYGYEWAYNSPELKWARAQLRSYIDGEYDDTKV